jgi:tight adherence protein C
MSDELGSSFVWISSFIALTIGASIALLTWLVSRALSRIPADDRSYKDTPPIGFRLLWLPILWVSYFIQPLVSAKGQAALMAKLRKAGFDYSVNALQFTATRWVGGLSVAVAAIFILFLLDAKGLTDSWQYLQVALLAGLFGWIYPVIWLNDRLNARKKELLRSLPFFLDIITLCVEAGLNMQGAINQAVLKGPKGAMRDEFQRVMRDIRAGKGRAASMREMADRLNESAVSNFVTAVIQAEVMGMNLGPVLRAQADQRRSERFLRAEKLAMEAPVKMLLPLIAFIFPCTFIVLFFPIAMKFMHSGL